MTALPKPDVVGTPFASDEWKNAVKYLTEIGKGDRPVRLPCFLSYVHGSLLTRKREWSETIRWDMANVHLVYFELFERVYLVSPCLCMIWLLVVYLTSNSSLSMPMIITTYPATLDSPKLCFSMSVPILLCPLRTELRGRSTSIINWRVRH